MAEKVRDLSSKLTKAIMALSDIVPDIHKLEYFDSDQASRRVKKALVLFRHGPLKELETEIKEIRTMTMEISALRKEERRKEYAAGTRKKYVKGFFKEQAKFKIESNN
jgi:hypothetical protein